MKKILCSLLAASVLVLCGSASVLAQTTLAVGELVILGVNTDNEDFTFLLLTDIDAGTEIYFTDNETNAATSINTGEGLLKYTAPTPITCGTVIGFIANSSNFSAEEGSFILGNSGDEVIAFQGYNTGTRAVTTFLHAVSKTTISPVPSGLSSSTLIDLVSDNGEYTGTTSGTKAALYAAVNTLSNWTQNNSFSSTTLSTTAFTVTDCAPPPPSNCSGQMSGTYTINSVAAASCTNYQTFAAAISDLVSGTRTDDNDYRHDGGVSGAVIFEVSSGTYTEQLSFPEIPGASSSNTVTFRSASGNNTDVTLTFASSGTFSDPNYTLQFNGVDYLRFEDMTIERTGTSTYARVIDFSGDASNNILDGNRLIGRATGSTTSDNTAVIFTDETNSGIADNTISNNEILYGFAGIVWESTSGNSKPGLTVSGNTFSIYRYALLVDYATDLVVTGNTITNNPSNYNSAQLKGIECFRCEDDLTISGNIITLTDGTSNYGIDLQASVGSSGMVGDVSNNMIIVGGSGTSNGINSGSLTSYKNYYYNSCYTTGTNATSASAFYLNGSSNVNIANNIFFGTVGNAIEILTTGAVLSSDYNDLYTTGSFVGYWGGNRATLADYQGASGTDANSISADPGFVSGTDLHVNAGSPTDAAATVLSITTDIDGETRDGTTPDIGADEFNNTLPVVTLSASVSSGTEAGTTVITLTATASAAVTGAQTVDVTVSGTGITAGDYTLSNATITIANAATTGTVTFTIQDDVLDEGDETATVSIGNPSSGIVIGNPSQQDILIEDNDAPTCYELIISEYHEAASGNEKYIEIYNPTASSVTLTGVYSLVSYVNGSSTVSNTLNLTGSLAAYTAGYVRNSSAALSAGALASNGTVMSFNGNDAIALRNNGTNIDVVGTIGSSANFGVDVVLRRNASVEAPTTSYDPSEWSSSAANDVTNIGSHTSDCFVALPVVTLSINTTTGTEAATTAITLTATADVAVTGAQTVEVTLSGTGLASTDFTGADFSSTVTITIPDGNTTGTVNFSVADDSDVEGGETATFTIGSPSSGVVIGSPASVNLAITDNDNLTSSESEVVGQGGETATIPSLTNGTITSNTDGVQVWHFRLYDGDGSTSDADDKPTRYSGFTIRPAAGNTVPDWGAAIADVKFFRNAEATPIFGGGVLLGSATIVFSIASAANHIIVADNGFVDIYMRLTLESTLPSGSDGQHFAFSIDDSDVNVNTDVLTYSQLGTFTASSDAAENEIDILATLQFIDAPTTVSVGSNFSITVSAIDANGNVDVDVTSAITLAQTGGSGTLSGTTTANLVNGTFTFTGLNHDTEELIEVTASGGSYSSVSANVNVVDLPYQLFDDFNRGDNNSVGIPSSGGSTLWTEDQIAGDAFRAVVNNSQLYLGGCAAGITSGSTGSTGMEQVRFNVQSYYETVFDDAGGTLEWFFNMKQTRTDPSGLGSSTYAVAFVLGCDENDFESATADGYAVIIGNSSSPDPVRLVRFAGGLTSNTNVTNVAVTGQNDADAYYSVHVTFDPCDGEWSIAARDDGDTDFAAPNVGSLGTAVTGTDQVHTGLDLRYFGAAWQHSSSCGEFARFDNFSIPNVGSATTTAKVWNGSVNADWNEDGNWGPCAGVPAQTNDVVIPNVATQPVISASPTAYCKDLTVDAGADLTINAGQFLNAWGDVVNNGAAAFGAGTFTMEGGATVTLNGNVNVANFHVSSPVTLNGTVTVSNVARSETGGALNANGNLVIESGAQLLHGTGTTNGGGTVTGNITVRRQGNASSTVYNYWSTPVAGGILPGGNGYLYNSTSGTLANGDDNQGTGDPGWSSYSGAMTNGRGYASTGGGLASFVGTANNGNITYGVTVAPGTPFNLVGNPYPSAISANDIIAVNGPSGTGRIAGALYFWDDDLSASTNYWTDDYAVWTGVGAVGGGGNTPNGSVATGQGFKVEALSAGTVQFNNSMRGGTNTQFFKLAEEGEMDRLWLNLSGNDLFNQALTVFIDDATEQRDALYDAYKVRGNADISLAMMQEEESFAVVAFPPFTIDRVVPLQTYVSQTGVYTFDADSVEGFSGFTIYLEDLQTGQLHELIQGSEVEVQLSSQDEFGRFQLRFSPSLITGVEEGVDGLSRIISNGHGLQVHASVDVNTRGEFRLFNTAGQLLLSRNISVSNGRSEWVEVSSLSSGIYLAEFRSPTGVVNAKVLLR